MSWFSYKTTNKPTEAELREARRNKLEADRLQRAQKRTQHRNQLIQAAAAQEEADQAYKEFLNIAIDIFGDEVFQDTPVEIMANFDELSGDNDADAMKNLGQIKVAWDEEDPEYFFQKLETELQIFGIKKQFTKRQALLRNIPDDVAKQFKNLVTLQETVAGDKPYKDLKDAIVKAYGPRPGAAFQRAMSRVMVSKPSVYLKLVISDICKQNLKNCCCNSTVWGLFQLQAPMYLKNGLANETFNAANMQDIMDKADNLWDANQTSQVSISAVSATPAVSTSVTAATEASQEVAAIARGRANGRNRGGRNRGGRGRGRGGAQNQGQAQNQNEPDPRGKRHESNPPWNSCKAHWQFAENAWQCQSPMTCPLKNKTTPKSSTSSSN